MTIEIKSVPNPPSFFSPRRIAQFFRNPKNQELSRNRLVVRSVCGVLIFASIAGADSLIRSYKYYSRMVDARLATGYLTSRPGLYAAPRIIRPGQKFSRDALISCLRRAGYVEARNGIVWNGSFVIKEFGIEIIPTRSNESAGSNVQVRLNEDGIIEELRQNELRLHSFRLEPEVLSNDLSSKAGERKTLAFNEIPPVLVDAILAIEDRRFFEHQGVDVFGVARAAFHNASDKQNSQGGSTITQQLVKNTYLSPDRTLRRKYAEGMLALALERRLSKQEIFALYCSEVYLGHRGAVAARGVQQAAQLYFGKELKQLSLAEAATLAGMIQSPTRFSPVRHAEETRERRNQVLQAMVQVGSIGGPDAERIAHGPIEIAAAPDTGAVAPYFVDYVNRTFENDFSSTADGRRIYTTIDTNLQQIAERAIARQLERLDTSYKTRDAKPQAALVAMNPRTGEVLAMVGGRDYGESQLNRATDARRQPGSTFKPFVYAAALEDGMSPVQKFADSPREFVYDRNQIYRPSNYGGGYSNSDVTMRTALVKSLNVVTVDIALQTGLARIANLSERFGLPRPERYPSLALGTKEVTPLELAAAYAAFANGGRRVVPKVIRAVDEAPGTHSDELEQPEVISPTTAYMITNMLSAVIDHGTARRANDVSRLTAVAGKTGTSRDGWFVGYTPNLVCVVWIGFDDNQQLGITGAEAALPAWSEFVKAAVELRPELGGRNFECPEGIKFVEIDPYEGGLATLNCPYRELIAVTERAAPHVECFRHTVIDERTYEAAGTTRPASSTATAVAQNDRRITNTPETVVDSNGRRALINGLR